MMDHSKFLQRLKGDMWNQWKSGSSFLYAFFFDRGEISGDLPQWRNNKYLGYKYEMEKRHVDDDDNYAIMKFSKSDDVIYVRFDFDIDSWEDWANVDNAIEAAHLVRPVETSVTEFHEVL